MQHVINNTKNNMFKGEHLTWKIIALVFCIKIPHSKSNLLRRYTHTHIKVIDFKGHFYFEHTML